MSQDAAKAVELERERCLKLLELYQQDFAKSSDEMMVSLWCRIRNQISGGISPEEAGFGSHLLVDDDCE